MKKRYFNTLRFRTATLFLVGLLSVFGATQLRADGTETLGPPSIPIAPGTGTVISGTGLATQPGTINIDIPAGATVNQVLLYWEGPGQSGLNSPNDFK